MLHTKFQDHRSSGSGEDFYHTLALWPSWSCDPTHFCLLSFPFLCNLVSNDSAVFETNKFNFEFCVTFGQGQRMTLTFDIH